MVDGIFGDVEHVESWNTFDSSRDGCCYNVAQYNMLFDTALELIRKIII